MRTAAIVKRTKDMSNLNYKIIQENERIEREEKIKKRELANAENLELFKDQVNPKTSNMR